MSGVRNIFACLVHEKPDCLLDLVRNLRYLDPDSEILIYDGSSNASLLNCASLSADVKVVWHPNPCPMKWGTLHQFALDCMQYAQDHLTFDTLTIVDSDQLAVGRHYSEYIGRFLDTHQSGGSIGMLGKDPHRQSRFSREGPARKAYQEVELWRKFVNRFPDGLDKFVHWTFWPSTVFTAEAARALTEFVANDRQLKSIMARSKIWATEEVILPTLVTLLGFKILKNPCSYDYVKYRISYKLWQVDDALTRDDVYWVHSVPRNYNDPLRQRIRRYFDDYRLETRPEDGIHIPARDSGPLPVQPLLRRMKAIEGWLDEDEGELLITGVKDALHQFPSDHTIVEIGSYCGRATSLLGGVALAVAPAVKVHAVDPLDGIVGDRERGVRRTGSTANRFRCTIEQAGLTETVELHQRCSPDVSWNQPICFLLIDHFHDYRSVSQDFYHFAHWLTTGGIVAFHDYADYFPGVVAFVNELLARGSYEMVCRVSSMVLLRKRDANSDSPVSVDISRRQNPAAPASRTGTVNGQSNDSPFVSCIMPTRERSEFALRAVDYFLRQEYPNRELIIVDDGSTSLQEFLPPDSSIRYLRLERTYSVGAKRNVACEAAAGEIVLHWDDDDWMADWRIRYQVEQLLEHSADICGLNSLYFFDAANQRAWQYTYPSQEKPWIAGGTMCYRKSLWKTRSFADISNGEDTRFVWELNGKGVLSLEDGTFYVALIHSRNTSPKWTRSNRWREMSVDAIQKLLQNDWDLYRPAEL